MLALGSGALDALTREQDDLLTPQPLGGRDKIFERSKKRIPTCWIREAGSHAGGRVHRDLQGLHAPENAAIILFGPFLELPDQFHMVIAGLRNALQVFVKGSELVQRPNHDGELWAFLGRITHHLSGEVSGRKGTGCQGGRGHAYESPASEHAQHGSREP